MTLISPIDSDLLRVGDEFAGDLNTRAWREGVSWYTCLRTLANRTPSWSASANNPSNRRRYFSCIRRCMLPTIISCMLPYFL